jgi:hypothetical protein
LEKPFVSVSEIIYVKGALCVWVQPTTMRFGINPILLFIGIPPETPALEARTGCEQYRSDALDALEDMPLRYRNGENGQVHYYSIPLMRLSRDAPGRFCFTVDDLNPLLLKDLSLSLNSGSPKVFNN